MSDVNVILATNRLQIAKDGDDILLDSVTYINITSVNPLVQEHKELRGGVPGLALPITDATVITDDTNWIVQIHMADGREERIKLWEVQNQGGWTNDADGYAQAEADIYAAFPAGGGGGSGTVTNVSGGTTGLTFSNPTTTPTMSGTLDLDNGGTGATTALGARTNLHAADFYPTLTFRTNTNTNADPGGGSFRLNSATIGSVTEMCVSELAHFETGDYSIKDWQFQWGGTLFLKAVASDDIMTISLGAITNTSFSKFPVTVTTVVSGVANDLPADNTVWRIVSVGYGGISAGVQNALAGKADLLMPPTIITGNTAYSAGHRFLLNINTGSHPEYTLPASPTNGLVLQFGCISSDMQVRGNGKDMVSGAATGNTAVIDPASAMEIVFSTTADAWLVLSSQGTVNIS